MKPPERSQCALQHLAVVARLWLTRTNACSSGRFNNRRHHIETDYCYQARRRVVHRAAHVYRDVAVAL